MVVNDRLELERDNVGTSLLEEDTLETEATVETETNVKDLVLSFRVFAGPGNRVSVIRVGEESADEGDRFDTVEVTVDEPGEQRVADLDGVRLGPTLG